MAKKVGITKIFKENIIKLNMIQKIEGRLEEREMLDNLT